jgi:hypothetical protein
MIICDNDFFTGLFDLAKNLKHLRLEFAFRNRQHDIILFFLTYMTRGMTIATIVWTNARLVNCSATDCSICKRITLAGAEEMMAGMGSLTVVFVEFFSHSRS